jgi:hypothetical protein
MCPASWHIKGFYASILAHQGQSVATFFVIVVDITLTTRQHSTIGMHIVSFDILPIRGRQRQKIFLI